MSSLSRALTRALQTASDGAVVPGAAGDVASSYVMALGDDGSARGVRFDAMQMMPDVVIVRVAEDFPAAVAGVRTLEAGKAYFIAADVDLEGDRLECAGVVTLFGASSETSVLRSTGLTDPLITTAYTLPMHDLAITAAHAVDIDSGGTGAYDWISVNFVDCAQVGTVANFDNWVVFSCAFLNSPGLTFTGSANTIGVLNSIFTNTSGGGSSFTIGAGAVIARRFRVAFSAFVATSGQTALNVSTSATIPVDSYLVSTCNFSGGGTYTAGVQYDDDRAQFVDCRGVNNSGSLAEYYMNGNATATVIGSPNTFVKVAGTTTAGLYIERFTLSSNRATHTGALTGFFKVTSTASMTGTAGNILRMRVALNGTTIAASESRSTANAAGRAENITVQTIVELAGLANDFIEIWVANGSASSNITVEDLSVVVERLN